MHATPFELELYVSDALAPEASAELERHCDGCDACAAALASEARLEVSLRTLIAEQRCGHAVGAWQAVEPLPRAPTAGAPSRPRPAALEPRRAPLYLLAAAACVALAFLTARLPTHSPALSPPTLTTDAGDSFQPTPAPERAFFDGDLAHGTP